LLQLATNVGDNHFEQDIDIIGCVVNKRYVNEGTFFANGDVVLPVSATAEK
jgi:hypothetical protein